MPTAIIWGPESGGMWDSSLNMKAAPEFVAPELFWILIRAREKQLTF